MKETRKKGETFPAFKSYRLALSGSREPENSLPIPEALLTEAEFIGLFEEVLKRSLRDTEDDSLRKFFGNYAPFEKQSTKVMLEMIIEAAGAQQHLRVYCERLLEAALYGGKKNG